MNLSNNDFADDELLEKIAYGDQGAFRILLDRHSRKSYRLAYRILNNKELAEDTVQEVMLKIWTKPFLWQKERGSKFSTWLYRVVFNASIDSYKRRRRKAAAPIEDWENSLEAPQSQQNYTEWSEIVQLTQKYLNNLPMNQRLAIILCRQEGISYKDAGVVLGISAKAVDGCINRGIRELKLQLSEKDIDISKIL